ncbi:hypothetical protein QYE76_059040 [Lolium multiflorum]|uniref:Uncharacterized protein n=1 Tax=Lolium multiflorum TaxID=4521 RepID=A0AAD8T7V7_LOLMU|nr:hypothetical protein QYE76_059040 [Lolium multiflorum]
MYLELLKEELETLWAEEGVDTWDAVAEEYFPLRAALITTVQDYLGYGYISCQVCHGHKACVRCMEETMFLQLGKDGSSKTVYMGHRRWLQKTDPWRKRGDLFDGTNEPRGPPRKKSGEEIDTLLKGWKECPAPGKIRQKPGEKKKKKETTPLIGVWKRRSVFWDLPYWKILDTPHCLDVMHITKNVCESLLGTLLNMPDRTKDGPKARQDLKVLAIREELQIPPAQEGQSEEEADGGQKRKKECSLVLLSVQATMSSQEELEEHYNRHFFRTEEDAEAAGVGGDEDHEMEDAAGGSADEPSGNEASAAAGGSTYEPSGDEAPAPPGWRRDKRRRS